MISISFYGHVHISSAFDFQVLILLSVVHNIIYAIFSYKKIFTPIRKTKEKFIFIYGKKKKKKKKPNSYEARVHFQIWVQVRDSAIFEKVGAGMEIKKLLKIFLFIFFIYY